VRPRTASCFLPEYANTQDPPPALCVSSEQRFKQVERLRQLLGLPANHAIPVREACSPQVHHQEPCDKAEGRHLQLTPVLWLRPAETKFSFPPCPYLSNPAEQIHHLHLHTSTPSSSKPTPLIKTSSQKHQQSSGTRNSNICRSRFNATAWNRLSKKRSDIHFQCLQRQRVVFNGACAWGGLTCGNATARFGTTTHAAEAFILLAVCRKYPRHSCRVSGESNAAFITCTCTPTAYGDTLPHEVDTAAKWSARRHCRKVSRRHCRKMERPRKASCMQAIVKAHRFVPSHRIEVGLRPDRRQAVLQCLLLHALENASGKAQRACQFHTRAS
jgi:hypothetical protein